MSEKNLEVQVQGDLSPMTAMFGAMNGEDKIDRDLFGRDEGVREHR